MSVQLTNIQLDSIKGQECLGKGSQGVVCVHRGNRELAIKRLRNGKLVDLLREAKIVSMVYRCKVLVNIEEQWIMIPRIYGRELFDVIQERTYNIGPLTTKDLYIVGQQLLLQLKELHQLKIAHCDVKLENTMIDGNNFANGCRLRLIDFGVAEFISSDKHRDSKTRGTKMYFPPEMVRDGSFSTATDMWCMAIMMMAAATMCRVPTIRTDNDVRTFLLECPNNLSSEMVDILLKLLKQDPKDRLTAEEALGLWEKVTL